MPPTHHITFASANMTRSAQLCTRSALQHGAGESYIYGPDIYSEEFIQLNAKTLQQTRGAGYWLWKPYIIHLHLSQLKQNDILIYSDAGLTFLHSLALITPSLESSGILLFGNTHPHGRWCKMDVLRAMNCDKPEFYQHEQVQASVICIRKNEFTTQFVRQWLTWAHIPGFIDDSPSILPNPPEFIEHRHDQAILTNLALLHNIPLHWWAAQYNRGNRIHYTDNFPFPLFQHHRRRNEEY